MKRETAEELLAIGRRTGLSIAEIVHENELSWRGEEEIAGQSYFVGIYPDRAVAPACWECHNDHSNRKPEYPEFKKNDVMGGIVIRIPKS